MLEDKWKWPGNTFFNLIFLNFVNHSHGSSVNSVNFESLDKVRRIGSIFYYIWLGFWAGSKSNLWLLAAEGVRMNCLTRIVLEQLHSVGSKAIITTNIKSFIELIQSFWCSWIVNEQPAILFELLNKLIFSIFLINTFFFLDCL